MAPSSSPRTIGDVAHGSRVLEVDGSDGARVRAEPKVRGSCLAVEQRLTTCREQALVVNGLNWPGRKACAA